MTFSLFLPFVSGWAALVQSLARRETGQRLSERLHPRSVGRLKGCLKLVVWIWI